MGFITKYWKMILVVLAILVIAWGVWARVDKKAVDLLIDKYTQEMKQAIANRDDELEKLDKQKTDLQNRLEKLKREEIVYVQKYKESQAKIAELEKRIKNITAPANIDDLVNDLRKRGYGSATRAPRPSK